MYKLEVFITTAYILHIAPYERKFRSDHSKKVTLYFTRKNQLFIKSLKDEVKQLLN